MILGYPDGPSAIAWVFKIRDPFPAVCREWHDEGRREAKLQALKMEDGATSQRI